MSRYVFHPDAEVELLDATHYYQRKKEGLGTDFLAEVRRVINQILANPQLGSDQGDGVRRKVGQEPRSGRLPHNLRPS